MKARLTTSRISTRRHSPRLSVGFVLLIALLISLGPSLGSLRADDPISGPRVGEQAKRFEIELVTGEKAGEKVDFLKTVQNKPVLILFVSEMTRPGFGLLRTLEKYGRLRQPDGLEVLIVRVTADAEAARKHSKLLYEMYEVKSPAGLAVEGKEGPKDYGLNDQAQMTVLLLDKQHKVLLNVARRAPDRADFDEIRKGIDKLLGPSPVPFP
jgi:hypothetical protein